MPALLSDPNLRQRDSSEKGDPPNPIERNDPEGSIEPKDPDGNLIDPPDAETAPRDPARESDDPHSLHS